MNTFKRLCTRQMKTILILVFALCCYSASACECKVWYSMEQNLKDADLVVRVRVLSLNDTAQPGLSPQNKPVTLSPPFTSGFAPNLEILKIFKGKLIGKEISLHGTPYCSEKYTAGQEYVLFIYRGTKGSYYTRICENNFSASDVESLKKLQSLLSSH